LSNGAVVKATSAAAVSSGTGCVIAVRPERLHVEAGEDFENCVAATVSDIIFQGNSVVVQACLDDGVRLAAEVRPDRSAKIACGQRVTMSWSSQDGRCFAA
jgi:putative spermidine/putrescine transport system ATP-binding protein